MRQIRLRALVDSPDAFGSTFVRENAYGDDVWQDRAERGARAEDQATFVAERDDAWIGMAMARLGDEESGQASVYGVWVDAAARRSGVAAALMDAIGGWAAERGARSLSLWVVASNAAALALYAALGFEATGEQKPMPRDGRLVELRLVRPLA